MCEDTQQGRDRQGAGCCEQRDTMMSGHAARLLRRAALIVPTGQPASLTHESYRAAVRHWKAKPVRRVFLGIGFGIGIDIGIEE